MWAYFLASVFMAWCLNTSKRKFRFPYCGTGSIFSPLSQNCFILKWFKHISSPLPGYNNTVSPFQIYKDRYVNKMDKSQNIDDKIYLFWFGPLVFLKAHTRGPMDSEMNVYEVRGVFLVNHRVTGASFGPQNVLIHTTTNANARSHPQRKSYVLRLRRWKPWDNVRGPAF